MILQLNPEILILTPKGKAFAYALIDNGIDHDLVWCCFIQNTGESWRFLNPDVRAPENITYKRK